MSCVEKEFILVPRKCEEYKGRCFYNGDYDLVVDVWFHRVDEDASGLTFEEWDPSSDIDTSVTPVTMIVNSSEVHATDVIPLQLEVTTRKGGPTHGVTLNQIHGMGTRRYVLSVDNVSEYELVSSGLPPMFHHNNRGKID
jgi:hypothetical protein